MNPRRSDSSPPPPAAAIRPLTKKDAKSFLSLIDALADYEKLKRPGAASGRRLVRDGIGPKRKFETLLAISAGKAVGYAVFFETYSTFLAKPTLYLEDLFVLPEHRGRGTGLGLFRACAAEAVRRGCGRMDWNVLDWNRSAAEFYRKIGASHLRAWQLYRLEGSGIRKALTKTRRGRSRRG
jgi:GNAT superfamily N-acetyltransferase